MKDHNLQINTIVQNLMDAGLSQPLIEKFIIYYKENAWTEQERLLSEHRASLLDSIHKSQKQIDCLDYLYFELSKSIEQN